MNMVLSKQEVIDACRDPMQHILTALLSIGGVVGMRKWIIRLDNELFSLEQPKDSPPVDMTVVHEHIKPLAAPVYQLGNVLLKDTTSKLEVINHRRDNGEYFLVAVVIDKVTNEAISITYPIIENGTMLGDKGVAHPVTNEKGIKL